MASLFRISSQNAFRLRETVPRLSQLFLPPMANSFPRQTLTSPTGMAWATHRLLSANSTSTNMQAPFDDDPFPQMPFSQMSNDELQDTSTIPGWDLIHSPPRKFPRGALVGTVVSDKMDKTVNVAVTRYRIVPKIRKRIRYTRKFMAHDEKEVANLGDTVMITPCHRISKHKHFMLREIVRPKGQL